MIGHQGPSAGAVRSTEDLAVGSKAEPTTWSIVLACDSRYVMPLATAMRSVVEANLTNGPLEFHVLVDRVSEQARRKVRRSLPEGSAVIRWVPVELGLFQHFSTIGHISKITYARLLLPKLFPATVSRILYLDIDLLVLDDLRTLWETDLKSNVIGAVTDTGLDALVKSREHPADKMPAVRNYFNAGVLLIDLDQWRLNRISEKALDYLELNPRSPFSDQDALNFACDNLWLPLDKRWNFQDHMRRDLSQMSGEHRPGIVHFVSRLKPWEPTSHSLNAEFYDLFRSRTRFVKRPWSKSVNQLQIAWAGAKEFLRQWNWLDRMISRLKSAMGKNQF